MWSIVKFWFKIVTLALIALITAYLFIVSLSLDFQYESAREQIRFRPNMPTQDGWIDSPYGKLSVYLFNVTNSAEFLKGTDKRIKLQQVGPIVYDIVGSNEILARNASSMTYRKHRYRSIAFNPVASSAPDILNQTVVLPNIVLLSVASKFHDWMPFVSTVFNALTMREKLFLTNSVYSFLWNYTTPGLNTLSKYLPNIVSNCGMLHNALREKEEVYTVKIGTENGMDNFFRITALNNATYFLQQSARRRYIDSHLRCPIDVRDAHDNSLFPPFSTPETKLRIVAIEACRTLPLQYDSEQFYDGFKTYKFTIGEHEQSESCLDSTYNIPLPKGLFDISRCIFNDAPAALSSPHFYGTAYNWSAHFEGLNPNAVDHESYMLLEPYTGIQINQKYRFQSSTPMSAMRGFSRDLQKLGGMVIPTFWYEFKMDDLPATVLFLMRINVFVLPILQPIVMCALVFISLACALKCLLILKSTTLRQLIIDLRQCVNAVDTPDTTTTTTTTTTMVSTFPENVKRHIECLATSEKSQTASDVARL